MIYVECPATITGTTQPSLFIAGGISNCPDWQKKFAERFGELDIVIYNPRRTNYPTEGKREEIELEQITWEFEAIKKATAMSFWFTDATVQPITLFELGKACTNHDLPLFVGMDGNYSRRADVEIQLRLERPDVQIVYSLEWLYIEVAKWFGSLE